MSELNPYFFEFDYQGYPIRVPLVRTPEQFEDHVRNRLGPHLSMLRGVSPSKMHFDIGMIPFNYYADSPWFTNPDSMWQLVEMIAPQTGEEITAEPIIDKVVPLR